MTRREFLNWLAATLGAVEFFFVGQQLTDIWHWLSGSKEGDMAQRLSVLQDLIRRNIFLPNQDSQELLADWLKFNAAEIYLHKQGYDLPRDMITHFLFGGGRKVDISDRYGELLANEGSLLRQRMFRFDWLRNDPQSFSDTAWALGTMLTDRMNYRFLAPGNKTSDEPIPVRVDIPEITVGRQLNLETVVANSADPNLIYSLSRYTVGVGGRVVSIHRVESQRDAEVLDFLVPQMKSSDKFTHFFDRLNRNFGEYAISAIYPAVYPHYEVVLEAVDMAVYDLYHFREEIKSDGFSPSLWKFMVMMKREAKDEEEIDGVPASLLKLPPETREYLEKTKLFEFKNHVSGTHLVSRGYATNFDISAGLGLPREQRVPLVIFPQAVSCAGRAVKFPS